MAVVPLSPDEATHLDRARALGRQGRGRVHPNPLVGCVIVKDGRTVGEGFHEVFGGPHAERAALDAAGDAARGATAYVTLEPCRHEGKTPPCARALVDARVGRVVFGAADPGPDSGGGADVMRAAGLEVQGPVWGEAEARAENGAFFDWVLGGTPFIALKLALSFDGAIAARPGERTSITGAEVEQEVHRLRTLFDAVMVGAGTGRVDDPRLTPRLARARRASQRILLDPGASLPSGAALLEDTDDAPVHVFVRERVGADERQRLEDAGARVHAVRGAEDGLDLDEVGQVCTGLGIRSILCEGGARLAASLLREQRVGRFYLFYAPTTFGAEGVRAFPDDLDRGVWDSYDLGGPPQRFGRDALLVLDRKEA